MDINIARAILAEAASGNYLDQELPAEELDIIDLAQYYYDQAKLAHEEGMKDEHILAIIGLGSQVSPPVLRESADLTQQEETPPGEIEQGMRNWIEDKSPMKVPDKVARTYPRRSSGGYSESDLRIEPEELAWEDAVVKEGLPIPKSIPEAVLDMPTDLTDLGDKAVRRLHSAFNAYLGRARWLLAVTTSNLANATHLRDEAYRSAYILALKKSQIEGEKLSQGALEIVAKDTDQYKAWNERVIDHTQGLTSWRALVDIYSGNVDRLSREWTMRTEQYERER